MSLFVAVISDCFHTCNAMKASGLEPETFDHYAATWFEFTGRSVPMHKWLHTYQLRKFLIALGKPLGIRSLDDPSDQAKYNYLYGQMLHSCGVRQDLPNTRKTTSISYRKLLWLLVFEAGDANQLPYV